MLTWKEDQPIHRKFAFHQDVELVQCLPACFKQSLEYILDEIKCKIRTNLSFRKLIHFRTHESSGYTMQYYGNIGYD